MSLQVLTAQTEDGLEEVALVGFPTVGHVVEEPLVVVLEVLLIVEVLEVFQLLIALVGAQVGGPVGRTGHGIDHLGHVLHVV